MEGRSCNHNGEHTTIDDDGVLRPEHIGENWLGYLLMEVRAEISDVPNPFPKP